MALEGSLDTFGLADVLSLLAMTSKTGDLRLRRDDATPPVTGYVRLRDGQVVAASSDDARQALARQLIVSGLISDEAFAAATASGATGEALPGALVTAAQLSSETVGPLSREQVLSAVFELLRWPNGAFTFEVTDSAPAAVDASLTVEQALAEAGSRLSAWPALTARVPAPGSALAVAVTVSGEASLTPAEWGVLGLFDGHRTIAEAITLSISGEWETVSLLADLVERGLLVPADSPNSAAHRAAQLSRIGLYAAPAAAPIVPIQAVHHEAVAEPEVAVVETDSFASLADAASALEAHEAAAAQADQAPAYDVVDTAHEAPAHEVLVAEAAIPEAAIPEAAIPEQGAVQAADSGDGVDEALLQRLIAGVRAL